MIRQQNFDNTRSHQDYRGKDISYIHVFDSKLHGSQFDGANAPRATFDGESGDLYNTSWNSANLREASYLRQGLGGASFTNADLIESRFVYCVLDGADFTGANLTSARVIGRRNQALPGFFSKNVSFRNANLTDSIIDGEFHDADLRGANFGGAFYGGANTQNADFTGALIDGPNGKDYIIGTKEQAARSKWMREDGE